MPYLNPARSLGPSFVLSKWDNHWVYWLGPSVGGITAGVIYRFILSPKKYKVPKDEPDPESSSIHSDEDTYDNLDKPATRKFHGSNYNTYRTTGGGGASSYCPSLASASLYFIPPKSDCKESIYGGTKSLYCKSPPLTRANLNRSQSVYTKSNSAIHRDIIPPPGPLVPTQSLYPIRLNQQNHAQNQNRQNQIHQRAESIYGMRGITPGCAVRTDTYSTTAYNGNTNVADKTEENLKPIRNNRPESAYGMIGTNPRRNQSSDETNYNYQSNGNRNTGSSSSGYSNTNYSKAGNNSGLYTTKISSTDNSMYPKIQATDIRQSPSRQIIGTTSISSNYHQNIPQSSPNSQY